MADYFKNKANNWDEGSKRVNGAKIIADSIKTRFPLNKEMQIMDFGVGTGLLGFEILSFVKSVLGVDTSKAMIEKLQEKNEANFCIEPCHKDIVKNPLQEKFDGIVSSMTLHHVQDLKLFFTTIYKNIKDDGFLAIADLESEDGTFHSNNEGVFHFGFDKEELSQIVLDCGFKNVIFENINTINKPQNDYGVFLLSAKK